VSRIPRAQRTSHRLNDLGDLDGARRSTKLLCPWIPDRPMPFNLTGRNPMPRQYPLVAAPLALAHYGGRKKNFVRVHESFSFSAIGFRGRVRRRERCVARYQGPSGLDWLGSHHLRQEIHDSFCKLCERAVVNYCRKSDDMTASIGASGDFASSGFGLPFEPGSPFPLYFACLPSLG